MALNGKLLIAGPFDKPEIDKVTEHFTRLLGQPVTFEVKRDESLIGGFLAMVDGRVYDSSIAVQLKEMSRYMLDKE
ncbi:MAG TPA: F0F1 ATP synthase subunit delta [Clostridia bacterium]|nr:F0F1 ATP synthase subunit delta [Clostridia bacterium]